MTETVVSNDQASPAIRKYFSHTFGKVILGLWAVFIMLLFWEAGMQSKNAYSELAIYLVVAYSLLQGYVFLKKEFPRFSFPSVLLDLLQLAIVIFALNDHKSTVKHVFSGKDRLQLTQEIISVVRDSTATFRLAIDDDELYKDCDGVGSRIRNYRSTLLTGFFRKENILDKDTLKYIISVDSALGDPLSDACRRASQFGRMLVEIGLLIPTKRVEALDDLFRTYHISPSAKATEVQNGLKVSKGLLGNYLIDAMQQIVPTFKEVRAPVYSPDGTQIVKLVFTT